jgi:hypothetical protein
MRFINYHKAKGIGRPELEAAGEALGGSDDEAVAGEGGGRGPHDNGGWVSTNPAHLVRCLLNEFLGVGEEKDGTDGHEAAGDLPGDDSLSAPGGQNDEGAVNLHEVGQNGLDGFVLVGAENGHLMAPLINSTPRRIAAKV